MRSHLIETIIIITVMSVFWIVASIARGDNCTPMYLKNHSFQSNGHYEEDGTVKFYWAAKDYDGDGIMDAYFQIYKLITLARADLCIRPLTKEQLAKVIR